MEAVPLEQLAQNNNTATAISEQEVAKKNGKTVDDFTKVWGVYTGLIGVLAAIGAVLLAIALWIAMQPT